MKYIIRTQFHFASSHRLVGHKGKCRMCHGHLWNVKLTITGEKLNNIGILWDFGNRKKLEEYFDHKTILKICKENEPLIKTIKQTCGKDSVVLMHDNPTAEHLANWILSFLKIDNPEMKFVVEVFESPNNSVEVRG